jgi:hypothetical protein
VRLSWLIPLLAVSAASLTACSAEDEGSVTQVTQRFLTLAQSDPSAACQLLAPRTVQRLEDDAGACADGLAKARPPAAAGLRSVTVAIDAAQVVLSGQAVFLARFDSGWRVTAAGCTRTASDDAVPYTCTVQGD